MVIRKNGCLDFEVYRKPCTTDRKIVADSDQDIKHEMTQRMINLPLNISLTIMRGKS